MNLNRKILSALVLGVAITLLMTVLSYHEVDNSLSEQDKQYIPKYLVNMPHLPENATYKDQLAFITDVQRSVLEVAPRNDGLPENQEREPKDLWIAQTGLCFDRSRVIEKILRYSGFEMRHIAIYSTEDTKSSLMSLIKPGVRSHAVTEVLTQKGWLVVDSNDPWVSVDADSDPISIEDIQSATTKPAVVQWGVAPPTNIYVQPFTFVYGLYSRHGEFYPPYDPIPDVNYGELVQNVL